MIRHALPKDAAEIEKILSETDTPWSEKSVSESIANPSHRVLVYGDVLGVIIIASLEHELEILNFAVRKEERGKGIGGKLLSRLADEKKPIFLDVRVSNAPAVALYEKHGFKTIGVRRLFYKNPNEDALLMFKA